MRGAYDLGSTFGRELASIPAFPEEQPAYRSLSTGFEVI